MAELIPQWKIGEDVAYEIQRQEFLVFVHNHGPQFEKKYQIVLRLLEDQVIEAHYPAGILPILKFLSEFDLSDPLFSRPKSLYYEVDEMFQITSLLNAESLQREIAEVSNAAADLINKAEDLEDLQWHLSHISEKYNQLEKYLLVDIRDIHTFYGIEKRDEVVEDLIKPPTLLKQWTHGLLSRLGLGLGEMNVLHAYYTELQAYTIKTLSGIDTISTQTRQDFDQIGALFISGEFHFEAYEDITLHHHIHQYSPGTNLLESYTYQMKIDTPKMHKGKRTYIQRLEP